VTSVCGRAYHGLYLVVLQSYARYTCSIRRSVSVSVFTSLVVSLVMPRLHYGNATLAGLPEYQHRRLQSVLNAAARLIYRKSRCQHVTPLLRELHWLRSKERVDFKLAVLIFRCLHGLAPCYLSDDIRRVADTNRRLLGSASSGALFVRPTRLVTMGDRAFAVDSGTICRTRSPPLPRCLFSPAV